MNHHQKDETAVAYLATAMNTKLARARAKGRSGWDSPECTQQHLSDLLREHVEKGDPVDVANFCAFLAARGEGIAPRNCLAQIEEPAGSAPAAPAIGPKTERLMEYRKHYRTWGRQRSDATDLAEVHPSHLLLVAEAMDELADALAAAPQAPAAPVCDDCDDTGTVYDGKRVSFCAAGCASSAAQRQLDSGAPAAPVEHSALLLAAQAAYEHLSQKVSVADASYGVVTGLAAAIADVLDGKAAPAAPAVDAELLELAQAIIKFKREHGSILAVHIDNLADLVDERAAQAKEGGE